MNTDKPSGKPGLLKGSVNSLAGTARNSTSQKESGPKSPFSSGLNCIHRWLVPLALAAVTLAVYWPVRNYAFINYDDPDYVTENRQVQGGISRSGVEWAFLNLHGEHTYWHPVTWVSHMLDCQLFGVNPGPHHLVNVAFHIVNALLLLVVLNRMTGAFWRSAMVAGLFALHPLQVDTVAWVTERKNVLSTFFWLLTMWAYCRFAEKRALKSENRKPKTEGNPKSEIRIQPDGSRITSHGSLFYLLALLFFAVGLMCKPALVTLPFVLLLLDYWPLKRSAECRVQSADLGGPNAEGRGQRAEWGGRKAEGGRRRAESGATLLRLGLEKVPFLVLAAGAAIITIAGHHEIRAEGSAGLPWQWRAANAAVSYMRYLGKTVWPSHLAVFYPHPGTWPGVVVGGSLLVLAAVSALVIWRARRAPYLVTGWLWFLGVLVPMIGIIQAGAQAMADRFAYVPLIGLFIMIVWGVADWFARLASTTPGNHRLTQINTDKSGYPRISPIDANAHFPKAPLFGYGLAALVLAGCAVLTSRQLSYWQNTTTLFEHALRVTRNNACAHFSLGNELADQGRIPEAMKEWETALEIDPNRADIQGRIGGTLGRQGDYAGAVARYRRALQIDPQQADVMNNLAWLLATCPEASLRNGAEAVQLAEKACQITEYHRTIIVGTLGAAYAEAGRFADAVATAQKACELAGIFKEEALLAKNQELLEIYRSGKAYHEAGKTTDGHR